MRKKIKSYNNFIKENVEVAPTIAPTIAPTRRKKKSPLRKDKPSVTPKPKAEDIAQKFLEMTKNDKYIQSMLTKKYNSK